ncbi:hypothetical protein C7974DRAFT_459937 [Boeremia exigua]|uniref:uncharacterized protein n=1 Tax=Boeremia exigua TaxID=749465 RepID=UPI001E8CA8E6|nr:uncharacterized protein C7974DRAFT_459937 [Boeremia exigua]KAH6644293.1 hypothetical protein C7974DRAFT_459937 [Boeremia exigua]
MDVTSTMNTPESSSHDPSTASSTDHQTQKSFSCVLCAQRKVKCDRKPGGCNNCTKARVPCIYKAPPPPRRRRKGVRDVDTTTQLRIYEDALRNAGIDPVSLLKQMSSLEDDHVGHSRARTQTRTQPTVTSNEERTATDVGVLLVDHGKTRYLENGIWTSLRSEFRDLKEILDETSDDESSDGNNGICQRIGQRIGLHRDGDKLKLPPFEAEIRRRLWWQIIMLEGFSQKLAGTGTGANASILMGDTKLPANLNDSDLFTGMKELPKESDRATEMMFFLIRCHVGNFFKRFEAPQPTVDVSTKERAIGELEQLFEQKFLRHCDSSIVWHLMCSHLAKSIIFMMRFMAYGAIYQGQKGTQEQRDTLFTLSLQVCSSQILAYTMKEMQGYVWHVNVHFQWKAVVFLISELRYRTSGPEVEQAWRNIRLTYEFHPTFETEPKRALPIAVNHLTLTAWEAYIAANGMPDGGEPYFIQLIRNRQARSKKPNVPAEQQNASVVDYTTTFTPMPAQELATDNGGTDHLAAFPWNPADLNASLGLPPVMPDLAPLEYPEQMNWSTWNDLLVNFQTTNADDHLPDMSTFNFEISLTSGAYSDMTITCGQDTYKVHKVIVCCRAGFFARAIKFGGQETQTGTIDLPDDDVEAVKCLIHYLYEGEYSPALPADSTSGALHAPLSPRPKNSPDGRVYQYDFPHTCSSYSIYCVTCHVCPHHTCRDGCGGCGLKCVTFTCRECTAPPLPQLNGTAEQLLLHAKMYEMGDKYDVVGLKDLAKEKFGRACKHFWSTPNFAAAAHHAFSTTVEDDKGLRDIVSATICEHIELVNDPGVSVLLTQFSGLALGILQAKVKENGWDRENGCDEEV